MFKKIIGNKPAAYFMYGAPGCGKSTFIADNLQGFTVVSLDAERAPFHAQGKDCHKDRAVKSQVWENVLTKLNAAIKERQPIVVDNTNIFSNIRNQFLKPLVNAGYAVIFVCFKVSLKTCIARNEPRVGFEKVPENAIVEMHKNLVDPAILLDLPGVVSVYVVDDQGNISSTISITSVYGEPTGLTEDEL